MGLRRAYGAYASLLGRVALDPAAADLDEGVRFPICSLERLEALWRDAGLSDVRPRAIDVPTVFRDFDDYWRPFLGGQAPAPGYAMCLDEESRDGLRERIRAGLSVARDGSISIPCAHLGRPASGPLSTRISSASSTN